MLISLGDIGGAEPTTRTAATASLAHLFTTFASDDRMDALATGHWVTRERVTRIAAISAACGFAMLLFLWLARHGTVDFFGQPVGSDFTAFWHAGRLVSSGEAAHAWDQPLLNANVAATHGVKFGTAWIYPPVFLLVAAPLAALPYLPALLVWQLLSLAAIALTLRVILPDRRALLIALAAPLTPMVLAHGQNAFLTAALLGSGLLLLDRRPYVAGTFLGCLVYKPQLGLIIAPLLLFTNRWRSLVAGLLAVITLVGLSLILWGSDSWAEFAASLRYGRLYMEQGAVGFYKSASLFAIARQWGASINVAYVVQTAGVFVALWLLWCVRESTPFVRAAMVCTGSALSTPYLLDYDMAVVGLGAAFLYAEARRSGFLAYEKSVIAFIWIAPWFSRPVAEYSMLPLGPIAMVLLAWVALRRTHSGHRHPAIDVQRLPGDVSGFATSEIHAGRADIVA